MTYRMLFAPDGIHWVNDKRNNRKDPSAAVVEINNYSAINPFAAFRLINVATKQVIYEVKPQK